jgi:phage terminase small subunit
MAKKLNDKHEKFCLEYVIDFNATRAYLRAYPDSTEEAARRSAADLLTKPDIQERISKLKEKTFHKISVTREKVIQEIANVAFAHIGLVCVFDEEGALTLKTAEEMGESIRALHSVSQDEIHDNKGNLIKTKTRFTMHDKLKALELLSKHLGILDGNDNDRKNSEAIQRRLSENLDRIEKKLSKRGSRSR